jgi:hypothetical protein
MNFFPAICVAAEFVGLMLMVTVKVDTAGGKRPNLPKAAHRMAVRLMIWPVYGILVWIALKALLGI